MELTELTDVFSETEFGVFKNAECVKAICVKNGASLSRKQIDNFTISLRVKALVAWHILRIKTAKQNLQLRNS